MNDEKFNLVGTTTEHATNVMRKLYPQAQIVHHTETLPDTVVITSDPNGNVLSVRPYTKPKHDPMADSRYSYVVPAVLALNARGELAPVAPTSRHRYTDGRVEDRQADGTWKPRVFTNPYL